MIDLEEFKRELITHAAVADTVAQESGSDYAKGQAAAFRQAEGILSVRSEIRIYEPCAARQHDDCIAVDREPSTRPIDLAAHCHCPCHVAAEGQA